MNTYKVRLYLNELCGDSGNIEHDYIDCFIEGDNEEHVFKSITEETFFKLPLKSNDGYQYVRVSNIIRITVREVKSNA